MGRGRRVGALAALVCVAVPISIGCGGTVVDDTGVETLIAHDLHRNGEKVSSVDCPSGISVDPGATFKCTVHLVGGEREIATLKIRDEKADIALIGLEKEASGG